MKVVILHTKNPVDAWNIDSSVTAEGSETISHVKIEVNSFPVCDQDIPSATDWQKHLIQKGQYPGENQVIVRVLNGSGKETVSIDEWDS